MNKQKKIEQPMPLDPIVPVKFEFQPFLEGFIRLQDLIKKTKQINMMIYSSLENNIGGNYLKYQTKLITAEKLAENLKDSLLDLKKQLPKDDMVKSLQALSLDNDQNYFRQTLRFSNLNKDERSEVADYYNQIVEQRAKFTNLSSTGTQTDQQIDMSISHSDTPIENPVKCFSDKQIEQFLQDLGRLEQENEQLKNDKFALQMEQDQLIENIKAEAQQLNQEKIDERVNQQTSKIQTQLAELEDWNKQLQDENFKLEHQIQNFKKENEKKSHHDDLHNLLLDLYKRYTGRQQVCKEVASVFKMFMRLERRQKLNMDTRNDYKDYLVKKIDDILSYDQNQINRMSEKLGGIDKYNDNYIQRFNKLIPMTDYRHELGCDLTEDSSDGNFSHILEAHDISHITQNKTVPQQAHVEVSSSDSNSD